MSDAKNDLWGEFEILTSQSTPAELLREQADVLTERTKGLLSGTIETDVSGDQVELRLVLEAGVLDYRTVLLTAWHAVEAIYPCRVHPLENKVISADDEAELTDAVKQIIQSPRVRNTIQTLLGLIRNT